MGWNPITQPTDSIVLAGQKSPGVATVLTASSKRKWDQNKARAQSGSKKYFVGVEDGQFLVQLRLYTEQDWEDWHAWKPLVQKAPTEKNPDAMDIEHPVLAEVAIQSVVVEELCAPEQEDDGVWLIEIYFLQHRKVEKALATPKGSRASKNAPPQDPVDAQIEELTRRVAEEAAQ